MTGRTLELEAVLAPEQLATQIADQWVTWHDLRRPVITSWDEVRRYVYATDTSQTSNSNTPWKNKTTVPKLCQIRDNLYSNYTATLFAKRNNVKWEANEEDANQVAKRKAIANYMMWVMDQPNYKHEMDKCILDYIDYGNCFATVEWVDERVELEDKTQAGYVGPTIRRISPLDIVFNPIAESFHRSPKIIRSVISMGEVKEMLQRLSNDENQQEYEELWDYLKKIRGEATSYDGDWSEKDTLFQMEGFGSYRDYLKSNYAEILTFYGDMYDIESDTFYKNHVITVVDRHRIIGKKPNPSFFGYPPIFHVAWRKRQDNLWGMGPLDNLIGLQYRLDHIENMRADILDLTSFPVQKVKGFVEDFVWQPAEKIYVGDEGDVELVSPDVNVLQANFDLQRYEATMEAMAGAPREAMGFRSPGEKTAYEVQRLENAASRIFQNKIKQFDELFHEPLLNAELELGRRNMVGVTTIKVMNNEFDEASFEALTVQDITGVGRIRPIGSRHFAEQAELVQNLTNLTSSGLWPTVQPHFSGIKLATLVEEIFNLKDYQIVQKDIAIAEQAEAAKLANALQEQVAMESTTATGMGEDFDLEAAMTANPLADQMPLEGTPEQ